MTLIYTTNLVNNDVKIHNNFSPLWPQTTLDISLRWL